MIVIPMAGLSSRFTRAGYQLPKYMLEAHGKSLFSHSVSSFEQMFNSEHFLFIALSAFDTEKFIISECLKLGVKNYSIVILDKPTLGQAETVYCGLKKLNLKGDLSIIIFNIDTFRPRFSLPVNFDLACVDGYLETFIGSGKNWSNVLPLNESLQKVRLTAEKQEISSYCCTGLYYWRRISDFYRIFESYQKRNIDELQGGEYYIAPMYNDLIIDGGDVRYSLIASNEVIFCGIPVEYEDFLKRENF